MDLVIYILDIEDVLIEYIIFSLTKEIFWSELIIF